MSYFTYIQQQNQIAFKNKKNLLLDKRRLACSATTKSPAGQTFTAGQEKTYYKYSLLDK
jgi:hypothetical protein